MLIKKDDNVLDLCCGDGSYSYLFFSDIANKVDAIDYSKKNIKYAKNNYAQDNINYICSDLLEYKFKEKYYDVVIWRAGVAYFNKNDRSKLFATIYNSLKIKGQLYVGTPLESKVSYSANQIEVITDLEDFENEFNDNYQINFKQETSYRNRTNINYILEKK
jgi:ubiquinone/menaquinone biosynthesis C-methylase UbiE